MGYQHYPNLVAAHRQARIEREQADFQRAIRTYCDGLLSVSPVGDEPSFSWGQCDSCGSTLGGDRHDAVGHWKADDGSLASIDMSICTDCAMWHANGELPPEGWTDSPRY